jgi:hypothetical protein
MNTVITISLICLAIGIYFFFKPSKAIQIIEIKSEEIDAPKKPKKKYYRRKSSNKKPKTSE